MHCVTGMSDRIPYGWNVDLSKVDETLTFGSLSREFYYANLLIDESISENKREVLRLLREHGARVDVVVPERGAAALHVLAGMEAEEFAEAVTRRALRRPGVDLNVRSEEGLTPSHVAATYGRCRVLKLLLTKGADPSLVDYSLLLDAPGHAFRERQWQAYYMLNTYAAILENEDQFTKYLNHDHKTSAFHAVSFIRKDESASDAFTPNNSKHLLDDKPNRNKTEDYDLLKKTLELIPLNDNSVSMIKNQINKTDTYQFPLDRTEESDEPSDTSRSILKNRLFNIQNLNDKLASLRPIKPQKEEKKSSNHHCTRVELQDDDQETEYNSDQSGNGFTLAEPIKDKDKKDSKLEGSETYFYGYAECEASLKTKRSHHQVHESDLDNSKVLNNSMLCKMSRIFLFMLKKRHSNYQQL